MQKTCIPEMQKKWGASPCFLIDRACKPGSVHFRAAVIYLHCEVLRSSSKKLCHHEYRDGQPSKYVELKVLHQIGFTANLCCHRSG